MSKEKEIIVYCAGGDRSSLAASLLINNGFSNVTNLMGGYNSWMQDCGKFHIKKENQLEVEKLS